MLLQSVANDLRLADVSAGKVGLWIAAEKDIDTGFLQFLPSEQLVQLGAGRGDGLAGPIGDFSSPQALRISAWKEKLDSC